MKKAFINGGLKGTETWQSQRNNLQNKKSLNNLIKATHELVPRLNVRYSRLGKMIGCKGAFVLCHILKHLGLGMITVTALYCSTLAKELERKPNILFILSDDLSYRDLSCYGQEKFRTPNLDKLAMNGIRFTQAYSGSPECAPSRASLITGMHMGHCRIRANNSVRGQDHLLSENVTVAEVLKGAGYATGFIGKWGIGLPGHRGSS